MANDFLHGLSPALAVTWVGLSVALAALVGLAGVAYWLIGKQTISEIRVQEFVHRLEEGGLVRWVKLALLLSAIAFMIGMWFFDVTIPIVSQSPNGFRGLAHE